MPLGDFLDAKRGWLTLPSRHEDIAAGVSVRPSAPNDGAPERGGARQTRRRWNAGQRARRARSWIVREDGRRERVDCETRSHFQHDLLHYAAETEASLGGGFWGSLASGRTLAEMNDRTRSTPTYGTSEMMVIERIVGALSGVTKGRTPEQIVTGLQSYALSLDANIPAWLTTDFVTAVQERMRQLLGRWKATPFGGTMELAWASSL